MTIWAWLSIGYLVVAFLTFIPTLSALLSGVKLNGEGASFEESRFSPEAKERLAQHFSRLQGTLAFWKREASRNARFHYYCLWWTIISSSMMPFLTQAIDGKDPASKWFLTTVATHISLLLGFHRGLKVAEHFKAFRHGESEFYDMYRRLLDKPETFGESEEEQIRTYFDETERIRRFVRTAETDSLPMLEDVREQLSKRNSS
uniref:SMODS and SLOG-associating 2TM effector domain-containing protein n=1 Tax=Candidatus Kentrum sp. TC TaxID=2126339 RepID=A0A450ZXZ0_9GAMM|nr:MAG: hypothetical protein BECKTC1821F_GA0114240_102524 [Candidatus Kentron sp. TC]